MSEQSPTIQTQTEPSKIMKFLGGVNSALPMTILVGQIVLTIVFYIWTQNSSAISQAQEIRENKENIKQVQQRSEERKTEYEKQIDEIKKIIVTKDLFEAYHKNDVERMDRIEKGIERILQNQIR